MRSPSDIAAPSTALAPVPRAPWGATLRLLRDPYAFMTTARERYGDIFMLRLGLTRVAVLSHPEHIGYVLQRNARNYPKKGVMWDGLRSLLGNGLIVSEGPHWLRQRRMMQPHFSARRLAAITDCMSEAIGEVIERWVDRVDGPVDVTRLCPEMTMAVIVRAVFGTDIDPADVRAVGDALSYALEFLLRGMALSALPDWVPAPGRRRYQGCLSTIDDVVYRMIERRRGQPPGDDLLSMLVALRDEETDAAMTDEELHDEVVNLFLAGYETTATGMAWALHVLAEQPAIAERVRAEVLSVTDGEAPRSAHVERLTYTGQVVKETFRRYPPAWQIMRTAEEDDVIAGVRIPAGTQVMLSFCGSHLHPQYWPSPFDFDPDRFDEAAARDRPRHAWMPFGTGQRMCIGKALSLIESTLILAHLIPRFTLETVPARPARPKLSLVTRSRDGIWLRLRPIPPATAR